MCHIIVTRGWLEFGTMIALKGLITLGNDTKNVFKGQ